MTINWKFLVDRGGLGSKIGALLLPTGEKEIIGTYNMTNINISPS